MIKWLLRCIVTLLIIFLCIGGLAGHEVYTFLNTPGSKTAQDVTITIAPGTRFGAVAKELQSLGAITDAERFRLYAQYKKAVNKIKAGEFEVNTGWTPDKVLRQITEGQAKMYRLSVREGLTWWATARAIEAQGFAAYDDFKAVIHDPEFLRKHHIPFENAEGFLFPETYMLKKPRNPLDKEQAYYLASTMVQAFWKQTEPLWKQLPKKGQAAAKNTEAPDMKDAAGVPVSASGLLWANSVGKSDSDAPQSPADIDPDALHQFLILASLVEKETGVPAERGRVAGVYTNRIRRDMLLQCDPTIIYGVGETFSGAIRRSQLNDEKNLYNTYKHPGLPPGPICSSGLSALKAAFLPEKHDYLFFVATGVDAGHTFSKTVGEHNKAVQVYRARMRARGN